MRQKIIERSREDQEIYLSDTESRSKSNKKQNKNVPSNSKSKMLQYNMGKKQEKIDVSKVESKIKNQVNSDKINFKEKRKEADDYYKSLGFKDYKDWVNYNGYSENNKHKEDDFEPKKYKGPTIVKKNVAISYDKNLKPADVQEHLKEIPLKKAKAMNLLQDEKNLPYNYSNNKESNYIDHNNNYRNNTSNSNRFANNNFNPANNNVNDPYNYYGNNQGPQQINSYLNSFENNNNNYKNNSINSANQPFNNSVSNSINKNINNNDKDADNNIINKNAFNNDNQINDVNPLINSNEDNPENEREMLSSFAPSEKTKGIIFKQIIH